MSIFSSTPLINLDHQWYKDFTETVREGHWKPAKYVTAIKKNDIPEFHRMDDVNREFITRSALGVINIEAQVKSFWATLSAYLKNSYVTNALIVNAEIEATHFDAYVGFGGQLGVDPEEHTKYSSLRDRIKYLKKYIEAANYNLQGKEMRESVIRRVTLFAALMERISLTTDFYSLMSYANASKGLKTISALQLTTALEEQQHFKLGVKIRQDTIAESSDINIDLIDDQLREALDVGYMYELNVLEQKFDKGEPDHISFNEVRNMLKRNFDYVERTMLGESSGRFKYDEELYREKSEWYSVMVEGSKEVDFFDNVVGNYSDDGSSVNLESEFTY